jgi:hypothetical protein
MAAINICKPGVPYSAIGGVIEDYVTAHGLSTTRNYCGLQRPLSALSFLSLLCQQSAALRLYSYMSYYYYYYYIIIIMVIVIVIIAIVVNVIMVCVCVYLCVWVCIYVCGCVCGWVCVCNQQYLHSVVCLWAATRCWVWRHR